MPDTKTNAPTYEIVVVGGGPAGYIAAIKAARMGAKTAIVEKSVLGGTCLNRGCIPTKTFLKTAELLHGMSLLKSRGVTVNDPGYSVDMSKVVAHKNAVVKKLTNGVGSLIKSGGIDLYNAEGIIRKDKTVTLNDGRSIFAKQVIFAGGSKVSRINIPGIDVPNVITSDEILDIESVPERLAIIGGGVIGVEMACVFSAFGSKVTVLEMAENILPSLDAEVSALLRGQLERQGVIIHTGVKIEKIEKAGSAAVVYGSGGALAEAEVVLLSIGRIPDLSGLGDLELKTERGKIAVDDRMRTSVDWVWAPGDINGRKMLAHAAFKMAEVAVENALGGDAVYFGKYIPACVYTSPEIACVGLTEREARESREVCVGKFPFAANGRALASDEATGFVKVVADKRTGELLGVHIAGPCAAEMINEAAALMAMEITVYEIAEITHAHPAFSEALMEAAADCLGKSLHLPPKKI